MLAGASYSAIVDTILFIVLSFIILIVCYIYTIYTIPTTDIGHHRVPFSSSPDRFGTCGNVVSRVFFCIDFLLRFSLLVCLPSGVPKRPTYSELGFPLMEAYTHIYDVSVYTYVRQGLC